ncbi:unnamed protein product [Brassica napus]|nr:unnamed protein product [Brassica napus]
MGCVSSCFRVQDIDEYMNPNSSVYRNCPCIRCLARNFLNLYSSVFGRGEIRALPSSVQATTPSITSSSSHDNFLSEAFRSTPRPLPYDADPRHFRSLVSRREKGSSHSHEEAEPLRSDSDADSESFGCKWANNKSVISEKDPKEEYSSKSSLRIMKSKSASGNIWDFPLSEDEDACPTCLEEYTSENPKIVTKCSHHFHLGCIYEWMERSENCPVCGKFPLNCCESSSPLRVTGESSLVSKMDIGEIIGEVAAPVSIPTKSAIYVWGYNQSGQTGRKGQESLLRIPKQLPPELFGCPAGANSRWLDISCGREHTAAVASDGSLFTWGANEYGQLGDGTEVGRKHPKKVKQLQSEFVKFVSCGAFCTAAIAEPRDNDGTLSKSRLWVWGQNQGSNLPRLFSGAFPANTAIRQVSCGTAHVVALSEDGLLQAWGYNEQGQLGRGVTCEGLQAPRVITAYAKFLDEAPELVKITQVSCGEYHTAAVSETGEVYTWGLGSMGQLGHVSLQSGDKELIPRRVAGLDGVSMKEVACGGVHTCGLSLEGALYAWGGGQAGQLGLGPQSGFLFSVSNGSEMLLRNVPVLVIPTDVRLVACGHSHTLVYMREGRICGWGYNSYGQAANEKSSYAWYPSPVDWCVGQVRKLAAGGGHSAVLTDAFSLKELCEFQLADSVNLSNASEIQDVAFRMGSEALARLCERLREQFLDKDYPDGEEVY